MIKSPLAFAALVLAVAVAAPASAGDQDYDDPAMHFTAPAGFVRVPMNVPPADPSSADSGDDSGGLRHVAAWVYDAGKPDARQITISIDPSFDGSLDDFERSHESEIHQNQSDAFVVKKTRITLANGMPAWYLKIDSGKELGKFLRDEEYLVVDGKRGIAVAYAGHQDDFSDDDAKAALASLSVVLYPRHTI